MARMAAYRPKDGAVHATAFSSGAGIVTALVAQIDKSAGDDVATETGARPVPVYDSSRRAPRPIEELRELWRYRNLVTELVSRDVKTRYKRSVLGVAWTMLNPLLMMAVLTFVFSNLFRFEIPHYPVYMLSAQIIWVFFAQTTTSAMSQLLWGGGLITRIYVPKTVFAVAAVGTGLVNMMLAMVPLFAVVVILGVPITSAILWLPLSIVLAACFTLGVGLLLSTISVWFPDVVDMYQIALTALYFFTPVMYPKTILPETYRELMNLNPMYHLIEAFRLPIYAGWSAGPYTLFAAGAAALATLALGWLIFAGRSDKIAYRL
jgi:homopolymeric O-antigen transport system permease protein